MQQEIKESISKMVFDTCITIEKQNQQNKRYLNKKEAQQYIGFENGTDFNRLLEMGLKTIDIIQVVDGRERLSRRYDKQDIDKFMMQFKR